jgi:hypothetical protein
MATETTTQDQLKEKISAYLQQYREKHFWDLYPCGKTPQWCIDAFAEYLEETQRGKQKKS